MDCRIEDSPQLVPVVLIVCEVDDGCKIVYGLLESAQYIPIIRIQ